VTDPDVRPMHVRTTFRRGYTPPHTHSARVPFKFSSPEFMCHSAKFSSPRFVGHSAKFHTGYRVGGPPGHVRARFRPVYTPSHPLHTPVGCVSQKEQRLGVTRARLGTSEGRAPWPIVLVSVHCSPLFGGLLFWYRPIVRGLLF
jgi:hypothetical protein